MDNSRAEKRAEKLCIFHVQNLGRDLDETIVFGRFFYISLFGALIKENGTFSHENQEISVFSFWEKWKKVIFSLGRQAQVVPEIFYETNESMVETQRKTKIKNYLSINTSD